MELLLHLMTGHLDRCTDSLEVFSLSLAMVEVDFWCLLGLEVIKHATWIQLYLSMTDHKCGIGISSIFDPVFRRLSRTIALRPHCRATRSKARLVSKSRYFGICQFVLLHCCIGYTPPPSPQCPPLFVWKRFSWITQNICLPEGFQTKASTR